jgi:Na+/proline symporter
MHLLDWAVVCAYVVGAALFAFWLTRRGLGHGHGSGEEFIVANRRLPWWIIGIADVATSGGADAFWIMSFFVGGFMAYHRWFWISLAVAMPLEILWARYWRRLRLSTPGQIFEVRYSGDAAARFRAFSALYGAAFGITVVLGYVLRGLTQSMAPFIPWNQDLVLLFFCGTTLLYTALSGLLGVAYSDVGQFALMMLGRVLLCVVLLAAAGGLGPVLEQVVKVRGPDFLQPYPPALVGNPQAVYGDFSVDTFSLLALCAYGVFSVGSVQSAHSAVIQKSLAARDERHAAAGQVLNALLSLLLRVVPLCLIGLCAVAAFAPGRADPASIWADLVKAHARPGLTGLLLVGIVAGYVSCIDGLVNFAASNLLNDVYRRYLRPGATPAQQVRFGRLATVLVMALGYLWARVLITNIDGKWLNFINTAVSVFMLPLGLLRWLWWRLNIWGEVVGFVLSGPLSYLIWFGLPPYLPAFHSRPYWQAFLLLFGLGWGTILLCTLLTQPESREVLRRFYDLARPPGRWGPVAAEIRPDAPAELGDAARRAARREERLCDLGAVLCGLGFNLAAIVGLGAGLSRRFGLFGATVSVAVLTAVGYYRYTVRGERLRAMVG